MKKSQINVAILEIYNVHFKNDLGDKSLDNDRYFIDFVNNFKNLLGCIIIRGERFF